VSFYTGTQCELLYAMPGSGAAATGTTATAQNLALNSTTSPGVNFALPANFFNFMSGTSLGKSLLIKGGGWFSTTSTSMTCTLTFALDATAGTYVSAGLIGATGAFTPAVSVSNGAWDFELLLTATLLGTGAHVALNGVGHVNWGSANDAAVATFSSAGVSGAANTLMICSPQTATLITASVPYFLDVFASWSTTTGGPTITMTNLLIFGLN
jgi:hypothetical protein